MMQDKIMPIDIDAIRNDFPILKEEVRGKRLVYLDSAGSSQKPTQVIESLKRVYETEYSNVHRGLHYMSEQTSARYEEARNKVAKFLNAEFDQEIIFTKGTTESINLVASSFGRKNLGPDDEDKYFKSTSLMLAAKCESQETMIIEEVYFSGILGDGETVYISEEMGKFYPIEAYPFPPSNAINYVCDYKVD